MSNYTQILYQIVFCTKYRRKTLKKENREKLFLYIGGIIKNKNCDLYQVNGVEDHVHIAMSLHPMISLSALIKEIKVSSSKWIKEQNLFPRFSSWQEGYGAFTYTIKERQRLINYIKNQESHHNKKPFLDEYLELLKAHGIEINEKYLI